MVTSKPEYIRETLTQREKKKETKQKERKEG
jgi:hypothetical protein